MKEQRYRSLLSSAFAAILILIGSTKVSGDETGSLMADAAKRFVASLDDSQKVHASFSFEDPERFNWHWIPRARKGLAIKDLKPEQRSLAFGLLNTGLSPRGMIRATTIMNLEEILRIEERGKGPVRDSQLYYISVFGTPGSESEWGWRVEGHHLSLNFTLRGDTVVSATPFMFGTNPALIKSGPNEGLRNLVDLEEPIRLLLASLSADQRAKTVVSDVAPEVTSTPNSSRLDPPAPIGISGKDLSPEQREWLRRFMFAYAVNFPEPVRSGLEDLAKSSEETLHFAWFGPADMKQPHAFRIQSPSLYIDFNNTQNDVNHIHTFYRSVVGDFGLPASR